MEPFMNPINQPTKCFRSNSNPSAIHSIHRLIKLFINHHLPPDLIVFFLWWVATHGFSGWAINVVDKLHKWSSKKSQFQSWIERIKRAGLPEENSLAIPCRIITGGASNIHIHSLDSSSYSYGILAPCI
ncbi:hypothetical protein LXL04_002353 [Taraxacum kok-saghyz]